MSEGELVRTPTSPQSEVELVVVLVVTWTRGGQQPVYTTVHNSKDAMIENCYSHI